jgi:hypothetical protein
MRSASGIVLLIVLLAAIAWLVFSIHGLVQSATDFHNRVLEPVQLGTTRPTTEQANAMEAVQIRWGERTMFGVAGVALSVLMLFVNSVFRRAAARHELRRSGENKLDSQS